MRVFISYGRKDAADFARRLAEWLRERGHDPWLDVENGIPIGAPFDVRIELGIQSSDAVLALLTPWSLRPEGFCRNEILYAQGSRRPVIPVRLADVIPPIQIISLNYIDAAADPDSLFGELPRALQQVATDGSVGYRSWGATQEAGAWWTGLRPERFEEELERHGGGFVGRDWLFEEMRAWAADRRSRLLLVTADVGFGKSAVVAQMSARLNVRGVHFCSRSLAESCLPDHWLKGLVYQLAAQFPAYRESLPAEMPNWNDPPESLFRKLIADPLREVRTRTPNAVSADEPWVFVVDALDESWAEAGDAMVALLADSASAERVPDFLRIVVTSRPDRDILAQFRMNGIQCRHLEAGGEPNRRDLHAYVERRLETLRAVMPALLPPGTAARLAALADGSFLFAKLSLDALGEADPASRLSLEDIGALKPELGGLYCAMFRKRFKDRPAYERDVLPLLDCLIASQGPVPENVLTEASGLDSRTASRGIAALSQFLSGGASGLRLFHQSLADWLRDPERSAFFLASPDMGHERLAEVGWQQYQDCASGPGSYSLAPYALAHLPTHLRTAGWWDRLVTLLTDVRYVEQRVAEGQTFDLIRDYNKAAAALPEAKARVRDKDSRDARAARWIRENMEYAAKWSARRNRLAAGAPVDELEPTLPTPPSTCRMWTGEEIEAECDRVISNPTRADRIDAFGRFVSSQCYALLGFGGRAGFVLQHAFNWEPAGPVREAAAPMMSGIGSPWLEREWPAGARPSPRPAELRTLEGHSDRVWSVSVTPDGRCAVSGSDDQTLRIWDLESGACLRTLEGHSDRVWSVSVTPDGRRAVSGSEDQTLRIWDLESGACLRTLEGHSNRVSSVSVTPDGRLAVSAGDDKTVRVWDLEIGACLRTLEGHRRGPFSVCEIPSVCATPDGRRAVSGGSDGTVRVWNLVSGACLHTLEGHSWAIMSVSVMPDGRRAVSGSIDGTVRVWNLVSGACLHTLEGHSCPIESVCVTPDGRRVVSGGYDNTVRVWDLESGACLRTLHGHSQMVTCVSMTPDGRRAVSGSLDHTVRVWDLESGACMRTRHGPSRVWDLGGACTPTLRSLKSVVTSASVTPDGRRAVTGGTDSALRVWDLESGTCLGILEGHEEQIRSVSVSASGRRAISGGLDKTMRGWDLETGACLRMFYHSRAVNGVSMTPDGRRAVSSSGSTLRVWDMESGACLRTLKGRSGGAVSVTPDGRLAVSGGADDTLWIWDLETGVCLRSLEGHSEMVRIVSVTPDGRHAVSGSWDKTLRVWHLESGVCVCVYRSPEPVNDLLLRGTSVRLAMASRVCSLTIHGIESDPRRATATISDGGDGDRTQVLPPSK